MHCSGTLLLIFFYFATAMSVTRGGKCPSRSPYVSTRVSSTFHKNYSTDILAIMLLLILTPTQLLAA